MPNYVTEFRRQKKLLNPNDIQLIEKSMFSYPKNSRAKKEVYDELQNKEINLLRMARETGFPQLEKKSEIFTGVRDWMMGYRPKIPPAVVQNIINNPDMTVEVERFAKGGKVKKTGLAMVHKGEVVIPANRVKAVENAMKKAKLKPLKK